jgi:tripartite-type tricarboxylate transporter receptor subunit TctC
MTTMIRIAATVFALAVSSVAYGQAYPSKPVRLIVPLAAGGVLDMLARSVGEKFQQRTGQPVVVEFRTGAAGNIGIDAVAKSAPDGYTWLFVPQGNITINATLIPNMPYSWERDFAPVTLIAYAANMMVVHPSVPAKTTQELIAYARANPGKLTFGSPGVGSSLHLIGELMNQEAGIEMRHVPYKGTTQALADLLGGQISMMFGALPVLQPQTKSGKLRALAVTTAKRSPLAPDVPTLIEGGVRNIDVPSWYAAMLPARTPPDVIAKVHSEIVTIVKLPDVEAKLREQGLLPLGNRPDEFAAQIRRETAVWAKIIKERGFKPE